MISSSRWNSSPCQSINRAVAITLLSIGEEDLQKSDYRSGRPAGSVGNGGEVGTSDCASNEMMDSDGATYAIFPMCFRTALRSVSLSSARASVDVLFGESFFLSMCHFYSSNTGVKKIRFLLKLKSEIADTASYIERVMAISF